jgi:hypothetical protein
MLQLNHEQFHLSWPRAAQAAYHILRAMIAWSPAKNDPDGTRREIRAFYAIARRHGRRQRFDPEAAARLELDYWRVHRELAATPGSDTRPLEDSLAQLHSALFLLPAERVRTSAVSRSLAAGTVDRITSRRSADVAHDWQLVESQLRAAYEAIARELDPPVQAPRLLD